MRYKIMVILLICAMILIPVYPISNIYADAGNKDSASESSLFVGNEELINVKDETDIEGIWQLFGSVDFSHLMRIYYLDHYDLEVIKIKDGLVFDGDYAAPINSPDGTLIGLARLHRSRTNDKYHVSQLTHGLDFIKIFREINVEPDAELYYIFTPLFDEGVLVETSQGELYYSIYKQERRGLSGDEVLQEVREVTAYFREHPGAVGGGDIQTVDQQDSVSPSASVLNSIFRSWYITLIPVITMTIGFLFLIVWGVRKRVRGKKKKISKTFLPN